MKNDKSPLISIIVPIYNTAKYLPKCLDSIITQTYKNLEIILINDGSTDNSGEIIKKYTKKDKRIKTINQENQGQSNARNNGLKIASGNYISFIDSDDTIEPNFIEKLLNTYDDNTSLSVCGINYKRLKNKTSENVYINPLRHKNQKESYKSYILYLLAIDGRLYSSVNKLYRSNTAKKCQFDEKINFAEDTKFVLDYLKKAEEKIKFVLEPLYIYNFGTEDSTMKTTSIDWKNWKRSYNDLKKWLGKNPTLNEKFWLHMVYLRWHISYIRSKRRAK